jgi:hypothetical protein
MLKRQKHAANSAKESSEKMLAASKRFSAIGLPTGVEGDKSLNPSTPDDLNP